MELSSPKIKKYLKFSHKKAFLVFQEMKPPKKTSYISGGNFPSLKIKKAYSEKICYILGNRTF